MGLKDLMTPASGGAERKLGAMLAFNDVYRGDPQIASLSRQEG